MAGSAAVASFQGPHRIVVVPVLEDVEPFRVVNVERPHHPSLVLDLTSNYERQARPRRIERFYSVLHMAVSTFTTCEAACQLVERFPGIATHVAMPKGGVLLAAFTAASASSWPRGSPSPSSSCAWAAARRDRV